MLPVVNTNDHVWGNTVACIELVEYGDYECLHCGRAFPVIKEIQRKLGYNMKFVFRHFPISNIHSNAFSAAIATEAAGLQNKFWKMHNMIYENQKILNADNIILFANRIGLDLERFLDDIQLPSLAEKIDNDFYSGIRNGVNKTPTFFINGDKYDGAWNGNYLYKYLNGLLRGLQFVRNN